MDALQKVQEGTITSSRLTVLTGRRRIGKTRLIKHFSAQYNCLYFFVSRKSEDLLCEEYMGYIQNSLSLNPYGKINRLIDVFRLLFDYGKSNNLIVVIDEFQELLQVNASFISEFQQLWDEKKEDSHLHIIISGSVYSLMSKIFMDYEQPLFGRADLLMNLQAFPIRTIKEILDEQGVFSTDYLLANYLITGGIPRYLEIIRDYNCQTKEEMIDQVFSAYSVFADEGKYLLIEEFGRDYSVYFSVLELIATGKSSRVEMESILESSVGGYLDRLENDYSLITQFRPFNAKKGMRTLKYKLNDPFLAFWFAFFHRYRSAVETYNLDYVKQRFIQDYQQYAGYWLERLFMDIYRQSGLYSMVGSYWESGYQNEIDLVAINEHQKLMILAEIKMNKKNIRREKLAQKAVKLRKHYPDYNIEYRYLSLEDLDAYL